MYSYLWDTTLGHVDEHGEVRPPFRWDDDHRLHLRAKLYDREDIRYMYSTFPIVEREEERRIRDLPVPGPVLAWTSALAAGRPDVEIDLK